MDLTTQCPECGAVFTASLEQLKLRKGYIRCVECANIFDGFEAVVDEKDLVPASEPSVMPSGHAQRANAGVDESWRFDDEPVVRLDEAVSLEAPVRRSGRVVSEPSLAPPPGSQPADEGGLPAVFVEPRRYRGTRSKSSPAFLSERRGDGTSIFRWLLVLVVLLASAGASTYFFRTFIAAELPQTRPALEQACKWLGCVVEYPQRIDRIAIMDSSLKAMGGGGNGQADAYSQVMQLTVVMRNTYDKAQQWPALTLDLVDLSGVVVSRRILQPADYLDARQLQGPFGAGQEVRLALRIVTEGLRVNGFKLGKFFPKKD